MRFGFALTFQWIVFIIGRMLARLIPKTPRTVKAKIERRRQTVNNRLKNLREEINRFHYNAKKKISPEHE